MRGFHLGGGCYSIGVLNAREVPETLQRAREEELGQVAPSGSGSAGEEMPSALQARMRILEMSAVFSELNDGILRAVARRLRPVALAARDTLRLGNQGGDVVAFVASGQVEESITDAAGKVLLTRRPSAGTMVILPAPRTGDRYVTSIYGLTDAVLMTLDRDGLMEGLGADVEKIAVTLDKLWDQELSAAAAMQAQSASRTGAPIVAFYSAKGGSGTTTLAVNTAAALARKFPRQVLLIDRAECLVAVVPAEIAAMTDARRALAIFRDIMNVPDNRMELVLNQRSPHPPLDRTAIESILGRKMSVLVGFDDSRPEDSTLAGGLVLQHDPSAMVSRGSTEIARVIMASLKIDA